MNAMNTKKLLNHPRISPRAANFLKSIFPSRQFAEFADQISTGEIEIRAAHEVVAARAAQLALLVDQLVPALRTKPPMLAGYVSVRLRWAKIGRRCVR